MIAMKQPPAVSISAESRKKLAADALLQEYKLTAEVREISVKWLRGRVPDAQLKRLAHEAAKYHMKSIAAHHLAQEYGVLQRTSEPESLMESAMQIIISVGGTPNRKSLENSIPTFKHKARMIVDDNVRRTIYNGL